MLIFEANVVELGGAVHVHTLLDGFLVQPALVFGLRVDVVGAAHRVVEAELLHEAVVGLGKGSALAKESESRFGI